MARYSIQLAFKGTNYHGWQVQENAPTIQQHINKALTTLLTTQIETVGAGRTDAGVHAKHFIAHFDYELPLPYTEDKLVYKLNCILSADISIFSVTKVADDFHARFSALSRTYKYFICQTKDPFLQDFSYRLFGQLDIDAMNRAAILLYNYTDFTSFSKLHTDVKTNNCKIISAKWDKNDDGVLVFTITADRFLRNMVRSIVGTLIEIGKHRISNNDLKVIIESKDRGKAGISVPAQGLFLWQVSYDE